MGVVKLLDTERLVESQWRARQAGLDLVLEEALLVELAAEDDGERIHEAKEDTRANGAVYAHVAIGRPDGFAEPAREWRGTPLVAFCEDDWETMNEMDFRTWVLLTARNNPSEKGAREAAHEVGWDDAQIDDPSYFPGPEGV